ncbi:polyketide antibiotic transporter [Pedococcus sp. KACC 23699]|uniref:Polyketide antibiotic transporter n=1 Tax=Pedococcus sp. KACC 23699 TaxID=3149228 RepID=A0AAU7JW21_9MICO
MTAVPGTGSLLRLALRRDRVLAPVVVLVLGGMAWSTAAATVALYPDPSQVTSAAVAANASPALVALYGPVHASLGSLAGLKMLSTGAVAVALTAVFLLRRHTRTEEETGRVELLGAGVVSRHAPLTAALLHTTGVVVLASAFTAVGYAASGLPVAGSVALGLAWLVAGIAFIGITAVAVQLTSSGRTVAAVAGGGVAAAYLLRAVGDASGDGPAHVLVWLSPLGWAQEVRPYAGERWWVGLLALGFAAVMTALAYRLRNRRDLGSGLFADRAGPAHTTMGTPLALAWRLQRAAILGWSLATVLMGAILGGFASNAASLLDSPQARDMIRSLGGTGSLTDAFIAAEFGIMAAVVAGFGIAASLRLLGEESSTRAELTLSTATSRWSWLMSHVSLALAGSAGILALLGVGASLADGATRGDLGESFTRVLPAALVQVAPVWVVIAVAVLLYGSASRLAVGAWVVLAACLVIGQFGDLLHLPQGLQDLSPFRHVPLLPGGTFDPTPVVGLVALAGVLVLAGGTLFRRRDVH